MSTAADIVNAAMTEIGVRAQGETLSAADGAWGLAKLNRLISGWNAEGINCFVIQHDSFPWASSKQSYTIGKSGSPDFDATRPIRIERANILVPGTDDYRIPLEILDFAGYAKIGNPEITSAYPSRIYYQPTHPNGKIWPWPWPTNLTDELELFWWTPITEFSALATSFDYPPGYEDALTLSLAESLCPSYGRPLAPELSGLAARARWKIKVNNLRTPPLENDAPGSVNAGEWDYTTGGFV